MNGTERIVELKIEIADEEETQRFYESNAYVPFEKKILQDVEKFNEILYNNGRASFAQRDINKSNSARVEIKVRKDILDHFRKALERRNSLLNEIRELEKQK